MYRGVIFDLDGVIVDSAKYHYQAWRRIANLLGFDFTEEQNEALKGVGRVESLQHILRWGEVYKSEKEQTELRDIKNQWYLELISDMGTDELLPGVKQMMDDLKDVGVKIALGSASKNSRNILKAVELISYFDSIIDGTKTTRSKPDPQTFTMAAEELQLPIEDCVVIEDSQKGLLAAKRGGFDTIGIGDADHLEANVITVPDIAHLNYSCADGQLTIHDL